MIWPDDMLQSESRLRLQWPGLNAMSLGGCKQAQNRNCTLWSTVQLQTEISQSRIGPEGLVGNVAGVLLCG